MAVVTVYTADHMDELTAQEIISGEVDGDTLYLQQRDGTSITAGNVRGPQGLQGAQGIQGPVGPSANQVDLFTEWLSRGPLVIAHRGAHNLYPENSMEGFRAVAKDGYIPELDLRTLGTGQAVVSHDDTTNRTMTGNYTVSTMTLAQWRSIFIRPQIQLGQMASGVFWRDVLDEFGGNTLICPEIKVAGTQAAYIQPVIDRSLQKAVLFQSFDYATAQAIAAAGCQVIYLCNDAIPAGTTPAQVKSSGINYLGLDLTLTSAATVAAAKAAGLKVILYTINTYADRVKALVTYGADGTFTNDPWFTSDGWAPANADPFRHGDAWPHFVGYANGAAIAADTLAASWIQYANPGGIRFYGRTNVTSGTFTLSQGWAGNTRGPRLRVRFTVRFLDADTVNRWVGCFVGVVPDPDSVYHDVATTGQNGYHCLVRRNGELNIYNVASGAAPVALVTSAVPGTPLASSLTGSSTKYDFEIVIDSTKVTFTNLTTGLSVTNANTAHRQPSQVDLTANGCNAEWFDVGVEEW